MKKCINGGLLVLVGITAAFPASAQGGIQRQQPQRGVMMQKRPVPQNHIAAFKALADSLAKQYEVRIVVDPAIWVLAKPKAPVQATNVGMALDQLVLQVRKSAWKRVYLKGVQALAIPPEKLGESLRAMDVVEQTGIVVETPAMRRASTIIKNYEVPANFNQELEAQQFDPDGIYVIYSTAPGALAGKSLAERVSEMQKESMEMMMQMDDTQLNEAVQKGLDMFMNMDPSMRSKFMGMQMRAGMRVFMNMPPDQRNLLMQDMMGFTQGMFGQGGPPGAGNRRP